MTQSYVLSGGAASDLREIVRYTLANWGEDQCHSYVAALEQAAEALATERGVFKNMDALLPGLHVAKSGKHYIFCISRPAGPALILAILHERMDIVARLKGRLAP